MKVGTLVAGIILLIMGVALYGSLQANASDCASFVGQLGRTFSSDVAQRCQIVSMVQVFGLILGAIGLGLLIYGAVAKGKPSEITKWKNPSKYLHEEYKAGYEEIRHKDVSTESQEKTEKKDNIHYIGILKERLAKGEISKEEYDQLKKEFESK